jgi:hypothetical protein
MGAAVGAAVAADLSSDAVNTHINYDMNMIRDLTDNQLEQLVASLGKKKKMSVRKRKVKWRKSVHHIVKNKVNRKQNKSVYKKRKYKNRTSRTCKRN